MNPALAAFLATLMTAPAAVAADPAPAAPQEPAATAGPADTLARRKELAEVFVAVAHFDDLIFSAVADQAIGFGAGRPGQRDAAAEAAFKRLQPELREIATDSFAEACSESTLRAAIAFYASDAGQRFAYDWPAMNGALNHECNRRWQDWSKKIRETPAPAVAEPAKPDKGF
jgi:hypothetical protein